MAIEDQIATLLAGGQSPADLVVQGFKKSTVYKVAARLRSDTSTAPQHRWTVTVAPNLHELYLLPGQSRVLQITITNNGTTSWLINQVGIAPAWLHNQQQWESWSEQILLEPGKAHRCKPVALSVPSSQSLGEQDLYIGVYGQWLDPQTRVAMTPQIEWSWPLVVRVQHKPRATKNVVLVTDTADIPLARQMAQSLENVGFRTVVSRDESDVGRRRAIEQSLLIIGLLTRRGQAESAVLNDLTLADQLQRRSILYCERGSVVPPPWHSRCEIIDLAQPADVVGVVQQHINKALRDEGQQVALGLGAAIAGGILVLLAALSASE